MSISYAIQTISGISNWEQNHWNRKPALPPNNDQTPLGHSALIL